MPQQRIPQQPKPRRQDGESFGSGPGIQTPAGQPYQRPSSASSVYDPDKGLEDIDRTLAEHEASSQESESRHDLAEREKTATDGGGQTSETGSSPEKIREKEEDAAPSLYRPEGGKKGKKSLRSRAGKLLKRHKWKFIGGGITAIVPILVALLLQLGSLVLPNLSTNLTSDRMKRVARLYGSSVDTVIKQKIALDTTGDQRYKEALDTYRDDGNGLMSKLNKWRPQKVAEQLVLNMQFNYGKAYSVPGTSVTREKLVSVTINGKTIPIPQNNTGVVGRVRHPVAYVNAQLGFRKDINQLILEQAGELGRIRRLIYGIAVRGDASKTVRDKLGGVKLWRWSKAEVDDATKQQPSVIETDLTETKRSYDLATNDGKVPREALEGTQGDVKDAAEKAIEEQEACVKDEKCLEQMRLRGDGLAPKADAALKRAFNANALRTAMRTLGTTYEISELMCLMYYSTVQASQAVIDANSNQAIRTYFAMSAAADAQRYTLEHEGDNRVNAALTGGYVNQLGDTYDSIPLQRADGNAPDTSDALSPQASAAGYHGSEVFSNFLPASVISTFASIADPYCKATTNVWSAGTIILGELAVSLIPGVGQTIKVGGTVTVKAVTKIVVKQFAQLLKESFTKKELAKFGAESSAAELAAILARSIAMQHIGAGFNGAAQGPDLVNQADAGATVFAQDVDRVQNASRPLTGAEYNEVNQLDEAYYVAQMKSQSVSERYFALNNPQSLVSRTAAAMYGNLDSNIFASVMQGAANIFNPSSLFGQLPFLGSGKSYAADPIATSEYGVVQWGWPSDEDDAYVSNSNYAPLYNDKVLDDSGRRSEIESKYGKCFNDTFGKLLADGDIYRNNSGEVDPDRGLCAPNNLGDNGADGDGKLTFKNDEAGFVFRWRVSNRNKAAVDQMLTIQEPTKEQVTGGSSGLISADGYAFPVDPKKKYTQTPCKKRTCHHDGTAAYDLFYGARGSMNGAPVYAISAGSITRINDSYGGVEGCNSIQFKSSKDGFYYWYGHLQNVRKYVKPGNKPGEMSNITLGQQIGEVAHIDKGPSCRGGRDHLHIDRGCIPPGGTPQPGGSDGCRDGAFVPFLSNLWTKLHYGE